MFEGRYLWGGACASCATAQPPSGRSSATVLAVALIGSSLLGTFALLLYTSEHHALDAALSQAPAASTSLEVEPDRRPRRPRGRHRRG